MLKTVSSEVKLNCRATDFTAKQGHQLTPVFLDSPSSQHPLKFRVDQNSWSLQLKGIFFYLQDKFSFTIEECKHDFLSLWLITLFSLSFSFVTTSTCLFIRDCQEKAMFCIQETEKVKSPDCMGIKTLLLTSLTLILN